MTRSGEKGIGLLGAVAIGVGGMVGGGIFAVLGEAVALAHGGTAVAFGIAGVVAFLTSYSYAKLAVRYPSQGGTVVFIDRAFGVDLATGSLNLMLWLSYLVTLALYAAAFGSYGLTFFDGGSELTRHVLISVGILVPTAINLLNAELVSKSETVIVVVKLALLAIVIVAGAGYVEPSRLAPDTWATPVNLVAAGMVIFVAYEGFELIANSAEEIRDPARTLPRAFYVCVLFVIVLYLLVSVVTVGTVSEDQIAQAKDYALAEAARPALGQAGFTIVAVSALLATLSAINATIYGNARLGFTLAKEGELPEVLEKKCWNQPAGVLVVSALSLVIANTIELTSIAILGSAGFLIVFAAVNASAVKLAREIGGNRWIALAACVACVGALGTLLVHTWQEDPRSLGVLAGFVGFSVAFELVYRRRRGGFRLPTR